MIDHIGFAVSDLSTARKFYRKALAPLGITILMEVTPDETGSEAATGFGKDGKPFFWIGTGVAVKGQVHVAFASPDRKTVDAFYNAAMAAGGTHNGPPGLRPQYHPDYYGAFVRDRDGNNIEAVCHAPE
jgi:catechol 2,3-dioxygenase-like lactoylglutathione lyase family enzyme